MPRLTFSLHSQSQNNYDKTCVTPHTFWDLLRKHSLALRTPPKTPCLCQWAVRHSQGYVHCPSPDSGAKTKLWPNTSFNLVRGWHSLFPYHQVKDMKGNQEHELKKFHPHGGILRQSQKKQVYIRMRS